MNTNGLRKQDVDAFEKALQNAFADITPALTEIGQIIVDSISQNFDVGGRHGPGPYGGATGGATHTWTPSKRALGLVSSKVAKKKGKGMTLQDTGRLAASITYSIGLDRKTIVVGTNVEYGAIHNFGGYNGPGKSVHQIARPFMVIQTPEDTDDIADAVKAYYARRLAQLFG